MSASPIGPVFAGMLWRTAKAMNQLHDVGPPTTEFRACWQCGGTKVLDVGVCRLCDYRGMLEYEVRAMSALLTNYEALLALSTSPHMTPAMRDYIADLLAEHQEMREALQAISGLDTIRGVNAAERKGLQMAINLARAALANTEEGKA